MAAAAMLTLGLGLVQAQVNMFNATTAPGGIYVNCDNGAYWPGAAVSSGSPSYPSELGSTPSVVDGNPTTSWVGNAQGGNNSGLNLGVVAGHFTDSSGSTFVQSTFGEIATIRIWSAQQGYAYPDTSTYWLQYPGALKVVYSTGAYGNPANAYSFGNSSASSNPDLPTGAFWNEATISAINGLAPTLLGDQANYPGYYALGASAFVNGGTTYLLGSGVHGNEYAQYVDVSVSVPAGATGVALEFGAMDYNGGGANINVLDVQAYAPVPEPSALALAGLGGLMLMRIARRRS